MNLNAALTLFAVFDNLPFAEKEFYAPDSSKTNESIYYSAQRGHAALSKPCDGVQSENTDDAPGNRANYDKNQCKSVHRLLPPGHFRFCLNIVSIHLLHILKLNSVDMDNICKAIHNKKYLPAISRKVFIAYKYQSVFASSFK